MAMIIREFTGEGFSSRIDSEPTSEIDLKEASTTDDPIDPNSLMVEIEGIHAFPHATRNYTRYMPKCLKNSVPSWTKPYRRPLIKHHNEQNGDIIGRVCAADYKTSNTLSNTPALLFTVNVPGEEAKQEVKNGLLETTSIGVIAHDVRCSICGQQLAGGEECEHERGRTYKVNGKNEVCYWDIYSMEAKELSYVIVPSDMYAKNIKVYPATQSGTKTIINESFNNVVKKGEAEMDELQAQLKEAQEKIEALSKELEGAKKSKEESDGKVTTMTESLEAAKAKQEELEKAKKDLEDTVTANKQMQEGLEQELSDTKTSLRTCMVEYMQSLRKALSKKELDAEVVKNRTEDSIRDSIVDMKEEFNIVSKKSSQIAGHTVPNPTIVNTEKDNNSHKNVEESNTDSNIDLEKGLNDVLNGIMSAHE